MIKYTEDMIKKRCEDCNLTYLGIETKNINSKSRRLCNYICNIHEEYGTQTKKVEQMFSIKQPCQYCNHSKLKYTLQDEINKNIELLSEYQKWDEPILCRCKIHGEEWYGLASVLLNGGTGCKQCIAEKKGNSRRLSTEDFKNDMETINPDIEIIGEYTGCHSYIKCKCKIDGTIWKSYACNLKNKTAICPTCAENNRLEKSRLSVTEVKNRLKTILPHITLVGDYVNLHNVTDFYCSTHDCCFKSSTRSLLYGKRNGCDLCSMSLGEIKLNDILKNKKQHETIYQHVINDCKYKSPLRFDFYDVDDNVLYEYQGEQHYSPISFNGDDEVAIIEFEKGQIRDQIKRDYCKDNNIKLIEIPYWEYDNMEEFVDKQLEK